MLRYEKSIIVKCPPDQAWAFLSKIENEPRWDRGVREARLVTPGALQEGAAIQARRTRIGRRHNGHYRVKVFEPRKRIALEEDLASFPETISYSIGPDWEGTKLTEIVEMDVQGPLALTRPLLYWLMVRDGNAGLKSIRRSLEKKLD